MAGGKAIKAPAPRHRSSWLARYRRCSRATLRVAADGSLSALGKPVRQIALSAPLPDLAL